MTLEAQIADLEFRLREVVRERDQAYDDRNRARAELVSTAQQLELERDASAQLRAEVGERMRETAEAQREACAVVVDAHGIRSKWGTVVRATPLVTEGAP